MYARASAPRSIGGVLDDAIGLYRQSLSLIWPLSLGLGTTAALPAVVLGLKQGGGTLQSQVLAMLDSVTTPAFWISFLLFYVIYAGIYAALVSALHSIATRGVVSLADALATGVSLVPRFIAASLLLVSIGVLGFIVLVIPGIYLVGIYQLVWIALAVERGGVMESFSTSARLIKGHWWRASTIVTVAVIISIVFSVIGDIVSEAALLVAGSGITGVLIGKLSSTAIDVVVASLLPCFLLALYYDLKLRHEGGDLAARVAAIAAG